MLYSFLVAKSSSPGILSYHTSVVLSHGLMGGQTDLTLLANLLQDRGCVVLRSKANEYNQSVKGVENGGSSLAKEILDQVKESGHLKRISFVGNSLGGLYARYAIHVLYDNDGSIAGLKPQCFMTIATPHLGVMDHTYLEDELGLYVPSILKSIVSATMYETGRDLFATFKMNDESKGEKEKEEEKEEKEEKEDGYHLVYRMCTHITFLQPLRAFEKRRLYANLQGDFMVPLGTAAFLSPEKVRVFREAHRSTFGGVVHHEVIPSSSDQSTTCTSSSSCDTEPSSIASQETEEKSAMRQALDSCGWEKVLVNFRNPLSLPLSHNKICAINKFPWFDNLFDRLLGFHEGNSVMEQAAQWLAEAEAEVEAEVEGLAEVEAEVEVVVEAVVG